MATKKKTSTTSDKPTEGRPRQTVPSEATQAEKGEATETPLLPVSEHAPTSVAIPTEAEKVPGDSPSPSQSSQQPKRSALEAAVQVLSAMGQALGCQELIALMAAKGYWTSPKGKTPSSTLYSALLREIQTRGEQARFVKSARGKYALRGAV